MKIPHQLLKYSFIATLFALSQPAISVTSVLIWPIDPVIEDYQKASSIWLENKGSDDAYFQIRVLKWTQVNGEDRYEHQKEIIVSPPFTTIKPKHKQLVRLVRDASAHVAPGREKAYRVLVDEIPTPTSNDKLAQKTGLKYQMRYFIPLFSNGKDIWTKTDPNNKRAMDTMALPILSAKVIHQNNQHWLEVHNNGAVHARLSGLERITGAKSAQKVLPGLIGYVLPNSTMRFPLPKQQGISTSSKFRVQVNNIQKPVNLM